MIKNSQPFYSKTTRLQNMNVPEVIRSQLEPGSPVRVMVGEAAGSLTQSTLDAGLGVNTRVPFIGNIPQKVAKAVNDTISGRGGDNIGTVEPPANAGNFTNGSGRNNGGDNGGGGGSKFERVPSGGGSSRLTARMDINNEPYKFELSTGIRCPAYSPFYHNATRYVSPLHITGINFRFPTDSFRLASYFRDVIAFHFTNAIQGAITFSLKYELLSGDNLAESMNVVMDALNVYFFFKSIMAYTMDSSNRNEGMIAIRDRFTPDTYNNYYKLEQILEGTPLPPNLVNICWYINNNFTNGPLPGSAIIKAATSRWSWDDGETDIQPDASALLDSVIALKGKQEFFGLLSRATNWTNPVLPGYPSTPLFDENFLTIWSNLPSYDSPSNTRRPSVTNFADDIVYNTYTNTLDGAAFAFTSIWDSGNQNWLPTLVTPREFAIDTFTIQFNRFSWYKGISATKAGFYGVPGEEIPGILYGKELAMCRGETFNLVTPSGINGRCNQSVLGVNSSTVTESAMQFADWLLSLNTIGKIEDRRQYGGNSNNNKQRKGKKNK